MTLNKFLIKKLILSSQLSIGIIFSIFFIFSLLGNLGESFSFLKILYLSLLSSIQILFYIPLFIFFLIISTFSIILRSYNEIIIIMHYISRKKIFYILSGVILIFLFIEFFKFEITQRIENIKLDIIDQNKNLDTLILIQNQNSDKNYTIIKNNLSNKKTVINFRVYNNLFYESIYSDETETFEGQLYTEKYFKLLSDKINEYKNKYHFIDDYSVLPNNKRIIHMKDKNDFKIELKNIFKLIYLLLVLSILIIYSFDRKLISKNSNKTMLYLSSIFIISYSYLIINTNLSFYQNEFQILSIIFILITLCKKTIYEKFI